MEQWPPTGMPQRDPHSYPVKEELRDCHGSPVTLLASWAKITMMLCLSLRLLQNRVRETGGVIGSSCQAEVDPSFKH